MKKIWISSLNRNENNISQVLTLVKSYHVPVDGHFWIDDIANMAWSSAKDNLLDNNTGLWIIIADKVSLAVPTILQGLSGLASITSALRTTPIPILILTEDFDIDTLDLPTPLKHAKNFRLNVASLGAKIIACLNLPHKNSLNDYRINFYPLKELGLWIEVGLIGHAWDGIILGVLGAEINFQAYGKRGALPDKATLEYPQQGFKIIYDKDEYSAWSIRNIINDDFSYFAKVSEFPQKVLFTNYTQDDEADAYVVKFC